MQISAAARSTVRYVISKTKDDQLLEAMKSVVSKYPKAGLPDDLSDSEKNRA
jgi:hypothetical protein